MADLRKQRTKIMIKNAFIELSLAKDFEKISVTSIAQKAMINRQTFYKYYCDKYELLEEIKYEVLGYYEELLFKRLEYTKNPNYKSNHNFDWFNDLIEDSLQFRNEYLLLKKIKLPGIDFQEEQIALIKQIYQKLNPQATELETLIFSTLAQTMNDYCFEHNQKINPHEVIAILKKII